MQYQAQGYVVGRCEMEQICGYDRVSEEQRTEMNEESLGWKAAEDGMWINAEWG